MVALLRKAADWFVISIGVAIGVFVSVRLWFRADRQAPLFPICLGTLVALLPLVSSFVAAQSRKRAALLLLWVAPAAGLVVVGGLGLWAWLSQQITGSEILIGLVAVMAIPATLGLFWFVTQRLGWGPVIQPRSISRRLAIAIACCATVMSPLVVFAGVLAIAVQPYYRGDCSGYDPTFVRPRSAGDAVFVGKPIYVGDSVRRSGRKLGTWAVMRVEKQFWGLTPWSSRFVVVTQAIFESGQVYFISGLQPDGLLTHALVVESDVCRQPTPLKDAGVELRVLHDGPPTDGVRIIGRVIQHTPDRCDDPVSGISVVITGTAGSVTTTTDASGIYDVAGLPPGRYSVHTGTNNSKLQEYRSCGLGDGRSPELASGNVWGCTIGY